MLLIFLIGFFAMRNIDRMLGIRRNEEDDEQVDVSYIIVSADKSIEDINEEITKFKKEHDSCKIIIYDSKEHDLEKSIKY